MIAFKNILILAPHTDDGELGCGASIARYLQQGCRITYVAFSTCSDSLPPGLPPDTLAKECHNATKALGINNLKLLDFTVRKLLFHRQEILDAMVALYRELQPDTVFLPARNDIHQDHQVIYAEGMRAFKNSNLLGYELPWNNTSFSPNYFEPVSEEQLQKKINALKEYKTQEHRPYMNGDFTRSLAVVRGMQCNQPLAEAFEAYKLISQFDNLII